MTKHHYKEVSHEHTIYYIAFRRGCPLILRIVFGLVWAVDAWFKWQPDFINNLSSYLTGSLDGQPGWVHGWITFWINVVKVDPHVFAYLVAIGETAVTIGLIFGLFSNLTYIVGILLSVVNWTTAEGFGGLYTAGSTDIGAAVIYAAGLRRLVPGFRWTVLGRGSLSGFAPETLQVPGFRCQRSSSAQAGRVCWRSIELMLAKHRERMAVVRITGAMPAVE